MPNDAYFEVLCPPEPWRSLHGWSGCRLDRLTMHLLPLNEPAQTVSNGATDQTHKTSDGREFSKLSEAEVDGLSDSEYDKYQKWKIARKQSELAQADERLGQSKARFAQAVERGKQLDAELVKAYFQMIGNFEALKAGGQTSYPVFQEIRSKLKKFSPIGSRSKSCRKSTEEV